jgi:hypothetical protein
MRYRKSRKKSRKKTLRNNYGKSTRKTRQRRTHKTPNSGKRRRTNRRRISKIKQSGGVDEYEKLSNRQGMEKEELIDELDVQDVELEEKDRKIEKAANMGSQLLERLNLKEEDLEDAERRAKYADELEHRVEELLEQEGKFREEIKGAEAALVAANERVAAADKVATADRRAIDEVRDKCTADAATKAAEADTKAAEAEERAEEARKEVVAANQRVAATDQQIAVKQDELDEKRGQLDAKQAEIVKHEKTIVDQKQSLQDSPAGNAQIESDSKLREELINVKVQLAAKEKANVELTAAVEAVEAQDQGPSLFDDLDLDLGATEQAGLIGINGPYKSTFDMKFRAGTDDLRSLDGVQSSQGTITIDISLGPNTGIQITPAGQEPDTLLNFYYLKSLTNTGEGLDIEYEHPGKSDRQSYKRAYSIKFSNTGDLDHAIKLLRSAYSISHSMINNLQPDPGLGLWTPTPPKN